MYRPNTTLVSSMMLGGGCVLHSADDRMFRVDNWSPNTRQVWGREITGAGEDYDAGDMIELPANLSPRIYVVSGTAQGAIGWVLNTEPCDSREADRMIAWQVQGGADRSEFEAATWDAALCRFIVCGRPVEVSEGPYTEAAWRDFMGSLPGIVYA